MRQPVQLSPAFVHMRGLEVALPPRSGWAKSTPVSITATTVEEDPVRDVPGLDGVDVRVRGPGRAVDGLSGVVQAPELAERGVVGDAVGAQEVVRLGVGDARVVVQPRERLRGVGGVDGDELGAEAAEVAPLACADGGQSRVPRGLAYPGRVADDQLAGNGRRAKLLLARARGGGRGARDGEEERQDGEGDGERPLHVRPLSSAAGLVRRAGGIVAPKTPTCADLHDGRTGSSPFPRRARRQKRPMPPRAIWSGADMSKEELIEALESS